MATLAVAGWVGKVYGSIDGGSNYREYGELRNFTLHQNVNMINADSHAGAGHHDAIPGIDLWDAQAECLYISSDAAQDEVDTAYAAKTKVKFRFDPEGTSSTKERWSGDGYLDDVSIQGPTADAAARNFSVHGVGQLTKSTQ